MAALISSNNNNISEGDKSLQQQNGTDLIPSEKDCVYTSCFCEENVWHLCNHVKKNHPEELGSCYCVFISNDERVIPFWCQKSSDEEDGSVCWDYHVIFLHQYDTNTEVYDHDTTLSFPCSFEDYAFKAIRPDSFLKPRFHRCFRMIPASLFLQTFASDRSHMLDEDGTWLKEPPAYPCLKTEESTNNIQDFINMDATVGVGRVMNFEEFFSEFSTQPKE